MSESVVGLDRNQYQPQLHGEKHTATVHRICGEGSCKNAKDDDGASRKRKKQTTLPFKKEKQEKSDEEYEEDGKPGRIGIPMVDFSSEGRKPGQVGDRRNGVTFAFI